jgi:hypothetical protein
MRHPLLDVQDQMSCVVDGSPGACLYEFEPKGLFVEFSRFFEVFYL